MQIIKNTTGFRGLRKGKFYLFLLFLIRSNRYSKSNFN